MNDWNPQTHEKYEAPDGFTGYIVLPKHLSAQAFVAWYERSETIPSPLMAEPFVALGQFQAYWLRYPLAAWHIDGLEEMSEPLWEGGDPFPPAQIVNWFYDLIEESGLMRRALNRKN